MKRSSNEVIKKAIGLQTKVIANKLGVGKDLVMAWKNGNAKNDIDRIIKLYKETGDIDIIKYICVMANGYFTPNESKSSNEAKINKIINKLTETIRIINEANEDNHINMDELFKIIGTANELKAELDGLIADLLNHYALEHDVVLKD